MVTAYSIVFSRLKKYKILMTYRIIKTNNYNNITSPIFIPFFFSLLVRAREFQIVRAPKKFQSIRKYIVNNYKIV